MGSQAPGLVGSCWVLLGSPLVPRRPRQRTGRPLIECPLARAIEGGQRVGSIPKRGVPLDGRRRLEGPGPVATQSCSRAALASRPRAHERCGPRPERCAHVRRPAPLLPCCGRIVAMGAARRARARGNAPWQVERGMLPLPHPRGAWLGLTRRPNVGPSCAHKFAP